eukprot:Skav225400  [mRNA]  locus=scaffold2656:363461:365079:+ [translate_table: standard]
MALEVLQSMAADAIPRNTVAFSSVLSACEKANEWTVALSLLGNMQEIHVSGDTISFSAAMSACEKVSLSAVISATEKAAEWETAVGLLHQALTSWSLNVNSVTFAAAISACEKAEEWQMACALLRRLCLAEPVVAGGQIIVGCQPPWPEMMLYHGVSNRH